ncbi:MAG: DUF4139 domain-containing protein [Candidatus Krumholzibacteriia bacterium]
MRRAGSISSELVMLAGALALCAAAPAAAQDLSSSSAERQDVGLTIYNTDLSLVREQRRIPVQSGIFRLRYEDVTSGIDPTTVHLEPRGRGELQIVEQNYEYDLISRAKLMEKYVGRDVGYRMEDGAIGRARLLSAHQGYVYQLGTQIVFELPGDIVLDAIPAELSARPTLVWTLDADGTGQRDVEVTYLSRGFSWRADYVLLLDESETRGGLTGWVTIDNQSGGSFENAQLKLVAGDVSRVREEMRRRVAYAADVARISKAPQFEEEAFFEYHLYSLQRRTDLKNNQQKQILFFDSDGVRVRKGYTFRGLPHYMMRGFVAPKGSEHVEVTLEFDNSRKNGLGAPIPQGIVRVYKHDRDGAPQFLGENRVRHTPKDETLEFAVGRAFDVVGEHVQTDYKRLGDRVFEVAFEVKLRNHKEEGIDVKVLETFNGDWTIVQSTLEHEKKDARTAQFLVHVEPDEEVILNYRARIQT